VVLLLTGTSCKGGRVLIPGGCLELGHPQIPSSDGEAKCEFLKSSFFRCCGAFYGPIGS
jgi:hypothetical protein